MFADGSGVSYDIDNVGKSRYNVDRKNNIRYSPRSLKLPKSEREKFISS